MRVRLLIVFTVLLAVFASGQKPSKKLLLNKQKAARHEAQQLRKVITKTKRKISYVMSDIVKADDLLENARSKLKHTEVALDDAEDEQKKVARELDEATVKLDAKREVVGQRMRALYMNGERGPIGVFIGSESFADSADHTFIIQKIADQDDRLVDELRQYRVDVDRKKARKDAVVSRIEYLVAQRLEHKKDLDSRMRFKKGLLGELKQDQHEAQDELDELERESANIEVELRRFYGARKSTARTYRGSHRLPVNGMLTSGFGRRVHPITGRSRMHTGLDIAAPTGTPIHASGSGTVIYSGYRGGYGNCIIIDHGGGQASLYGHCSRLYVGVGKTVDKGDVIAAVGSTGMSTGPHLHWEIRINGTPVNPRGR
ncbi:MAG: peptidoglycan DD-metalloendopeptidase family protein [Armatimonadetes bacterium]|nr:peptidoglycan DD-metalloendopeptidase family protein [Armatimonadota bacterium]